MQICDVIHARARQYPDRPALVEGDRITSYAVLSDQVRKTAAALRTLGVRSGDLVGLFLWENTRHVVTKLAVIQAGAAAFTLDRRSKTEVERLLALLPAQTKVLCEAGQKMPDCADLVPLDDDWDRRIAKQPIEVFPGIDGDNPVLVTLTSGSTGGFKAVASTQRQHMWRYLQKNLYLPAAGSERYLSTLPLSFSAGNNFILYYLMSGGTVVLHPTLFSTSELVEAINRLEITSLFLVPTILGRFLSMAGDSGLLLPNSPKLILSGAPISARAKIKCLDSVTPNLYCVYAASGAGWIAVADPVDSRHHPESTGRCVTSTEVQIVDDTDRPVPAGETGRIRCRGETVVNSFYPGLPAEGRNETHRGGFYYPGDLAHFDEQGYLYLDGRASTMIIRGGVNIYPEYIEKALTDHEAVDEVAVCGVADSDYGEEIAAMVVSRAGTSVRELENFTRRSLGAKYLPRHFLFVDQLPRTHTGKVDRKKLTLLAESLLPGQAETAPPA